MPQPQLGPVQVNDIVSLNIYARLFNQLVMNTFYYECVVVPNNNPDMWDCYSLIHDTLVGNSGFFTAYKALISADATIETIRIQRIVPTRQLFRSFTVNQTGDGDTCSSANIAASIERHGDKANRQAIGRVQLYGVPTSDISMGKLSAGYQTLMGNFATKLVASLSVAPGGLFDPVLTGITRPAGTRHTQTIVAAYPKDTVRVMRRRTVGLGE